MSLLLQDKIFISTRPEGQSDELALLFSGAGATFIEMPVVKIQPRSLTDSEKKSFLQPEQYQWIVFTSPNGVRYFFENFEEISGNQKLPESIRIAVVGSKTEKVLQSYGYQASFVNPGSTGEDFALSFIQQLKTTGQKPAVLLALGNLARTVIEDQISNYAFCTRINLYETVSHNTRDEEIMQQIANDKYEMILFTSPSGIENFLKLAVNIKQEKIRMACIGETTAGAALKNNIAPLVVAKNSTAKGLFESVVNYYQK